MRIGKGRIRSRKREREILDEIANIVYRIRREAERGAILVVEGKRDEEALRRLGINGEVIRYSEVGRRCFMDLMEKGGGEKLIVLTDFDEGGEEMLRLIERDTTNNGVKADTRMRKRLFEAARTYASSVEGLGKIAEEVKRRNTLRLDGARILGIGGGFPRYFKQSNSEKYYA